MILTSAQLAQLIAQARRDAPNETCGLIGGRDARALEIYPLKNIDASPRTCYFADPQELVRATLDIQVRGWQVLAIYHSHPASPAYPSPTDVARTFYPDAIYIVISLLNPETTQVRGFQIHGSQISEVTLDIEE